MKGVSHTVDIMASDGQSIISKDIDNVLGDIPVAASHGLIQIHMTENTMC